MRAPVVLITCALALVGCGGTAAAKAKHPYNAIYCTPFDARYGTRYFAGKELPDGSLMFGVSLWYANGHNVSVYGRAHREGKHWTYSEDMAATDPADHCKVTIDIRPDGTPRVRADRVARCQNNGGYGTELGVVTFPAKAFHKRVTHHLDDAEAFQNQDVCDGIGDPKNLRF